MFTPLGLVESQLKTFIKAKRKSEEAYESGRISLELHKEHVKNLDPLIAEWTEAVEIFKKALSEKK